MFFLLVDASSVLSMHAVNCLKCLVCKVTVLCVKWANKLSSLTVLRDLWRTKPTRGKHGKLAGQTTDSKYQGNEIDSSNE